MVWDAFVVQHGMVQLSSQKLGKLILGSCEDRRQNQKKKIIGWTARYFYDFIVFEVEWVHFRGINYLNELQVHITTIIQLNHFNIIISFCWTDTILIHFLFKFIGSNLPSNFEINFESQSSLDINSKVFARIRNMTFQLNIFVLLFITFLY
jgi:hypothetical protein